ncbi:MAG: KilA-N domain-containing protein, partial [Bacteroidia bacterium]
MAKQSLHVDGVEITLKQFKEEDYINLTDMVRNLEHGSKIIENWFRNKNTLEFLGVWERLYNPDFNSLEFEGIMRDAGVSRFFISAKQWVEKTNAIGIIAKAGRYGGTYAHSDIAFEFGAAISPEFKLLLIREFQRLKADEYNRKKLEWSYQRFLTKVNYRLHTDSIRDHLIPKLQASKAGQWLVYADEAD